LKEVDIVAPSNPGRGRSAPETAALLAEVDAEGGTVRLVARPHNMSQSLIYNWRSTRLATAVAMVAPQRNNFRRSER